MSDPGYRPYLPQLTLRPVADDLWIVDGPEIAYRFAGMTLPCPTRMTVVRIGGNKLWLHSPTAYDAALAGQLAALGDVAWIIAPNSFHYAHVAAWARAFPDAACHISPDLADRLSGALPRHDLLRNATPDDWANEIDQLLVALGRFTEAVFFHRPTATLIATDLLQNFERDRIPGVFTRIALQLGGATGPRGGTSADIKLAARGHHAAMRAAAATMIAWQPTRIIFSHGKCFDTDVASELATAFAWANGR